MNEDANVAVVQKIYSDFADGNVPAVLSALSDDIVFKQPVAGASPLAGTFHGPEEVGRWFARMDELTETRAFEPREFVAQGNKVVALGYYEFLAKPTGKTWDAEWAMVWTFGDGKVVDFQFYGDTAAEAAAFAG